MDDINSIIEIKSSILNISSMNSDLLIKINNTFKIHIWIDMRIIHTATGLDFQKSWKILLMLEIYGVLEPYIDIYHINHDIPIMRKKVKEFANHFPIKCSECGDLIEEEDVLYDYQYKKIINFILV